MDGRPVTASDQFSCVHLYYRITISRNHLSMLICQVFFHHIITVDTFRPDLLLLTTNNRLFILELTVGFETNLDFNAKRKREKYLTLTRHLQSSFTSVHFVNLSISSLGIFGLSCSSFIDMCNALDVDEKHLRYLISKLSNTIIRTTYYIFCRRNKTWTNPELLLF